MPPRYKKLLTISNELFFKQKLQKPQRLEDSQHPLHSTVQKLQKRIGSSQSISQSKKQKVQKSQKRLGSSSAFPLPQKQKSQKRMGSNTLLPPHKKQKSQKPQKRLEDSRVTPLYQNVENEAGNGQYSLSNNIKNAGLLSKIKKIYLLQNCFFPKIILEILDGENFSIGELNQDNEASEFFSNLWLYYQWLIDCNDKIQNFENVSEEYCSMNASLAINDFFYQYCIKSENVNLKTYNAAKQYVENGAEYIEKIKTIMTNALMNFSMTRGDDCLIEIYNFTKNLSSMLKEAQTSLRFLKCYDRAHRSYIIAIYDKIKAMQYNLGPTYPKLNTLEQRALDSLNSLNILKMNKIKQIFQDIYFLPNNVLKILVDSPFDVYNNRFDFKKARIMFANIANNIKNLDSCLQSIENFRQKIEDSDIKYTHEELNVELEEICSKFNKIQHECLGHEEQQKIAEYVSGAARKLRIVASIISIFLQDKPSQKEHIREWLNGFIEKLCSISCEFNDLLKYDTEKNKYIFKIKCAIKLVKTKLSHCSEQPGLSYALEKSAHPATDDVVLWCDGNKNTLVALNGLQSDAIIKDAKQHICNFKNLEKIIKNFFTVIQQHSEKFCFKKFEECILRLKKIQEELVDYNLKFNSQKQNVINCIVHHVRLKEVILMALESNMHFAEKNNLAIIALAMKLQLQDLGNILKEKINQENVIKDYRDEERIGASSLMFEIKHARRLLGLDEIPTKQPLFSAQSVDCNQVIIENLRILLDELKKNKEKLCTQEIPSSTLAREKRSNKLKELDMVDEDICKKVTFYNPSVRKKSFSKLEPSSQIEDVLMSFDMNVEEILQLDTRANLEYLQ